MDGFPKDRARVHPPHDVVLLVPEAVIPLDLVIPLQVFGPWPLPQDGKAGGPRNPYRLTVADAGGAPAVGPFLAARGTRPLTALRRADTIVVPGTADPLASPRPALLAELRAAAARGCRIVSVCTGAFTLAAAGLLDGRTATTHWYWADELRTRYPEIDVQEEHLYVDEGDVITSGGLLAGMDVCLHLLRRDTGQRIANEVAQFLVSAPHREGGQAQFIPRPCAPPTADVAAALEHIATHHHQPLSVEGIAAAARTSPRTLTRRFREAMGTTVWDWVTQQRTAAARDLLENTDLPLTEVARRAGFGTPESLRVHFHRSLRVSPSRYRTTFRQPATTAAGG